jgi:hypothetical protein
MRVSIGTLALTVLVLPGASRAHAGELAVVSHNTLVFVDSRDEGGEWAAYRVVDERSPAIFRVPGPARLLLKLRTFIGKEPKDAVAAILRDGEIILTARVEPVEDEEVRFVDAPKGQAPSQVRAYVVQLGAGEHTVIIRFSEGAPLVANAQALDAAGAVEMIARDDVDVPVVTKKERSPSVQHVGKLRIGESEVASAGEEDASEPASRVEGAVERRAWARDRLASAGGTGAPEREPRIGPKESERAERLPFGGVARKRTLTVQAPYLVAEVRAGAMMSRLGLNPAPSIGGSARVPFPGLDPREWTIGAAVDLAYAHGSLDVVDDSGRVALDVAKLTHASCMLTADVRFVFAHVEGALDPYVSLGGGALLSVLSAEDASGSRTSGANGGLASVRLGAAFGPLGSRPFVEIAAAIGRVSSSITRASASHVLDDHAGYAAFFADIGYRFEMLTEVPTE